MRITTLILAGVCLGCLTTSATASPTDQTGHSRIDPYAVAESLQQSGNPRIANAILYERIRSEDAMADDYIKLSQNLLRTANYEEAIEMLQNARKKYPEDTLVIYQLGRSYIAAGRSKDAVQTMDMLTAMEPYNAMAYNAKAVAFDRAGNHFAAREIYEMGLQVDPESVALQNNLAMSLILDHKPYEAIAVLERLYVSETENTKVRHNLALAYGLTGNKKRALELGLEDLPEKEARENLEFYEHYSTLQKSHKPVSLLTSDDQILTDQTTEETPVPIEEEKEEISSAYPKVIVENEQDEDDDYEEDIDDEEDDEEETELMSKQSSNESSPETLAEKSDAETEAELNELAPTAGPPSEEDDTVYQEKEPFFGNDAVYSYPKKKERF